MPLNENIERLLKAREKKPKKVYAGIAKKSAKRLAEEKAEKMGGGAKVSFYELEMWFQDKLMRHWDYTGMCLCMECGSPIPHSFSRHATAHLLPKKLFPSVATHELNYLILGAGCGCHEKTHRIDKFITMKIWPEAAKRIKVMIPLLPIDELRKISNQLLTALDNT